MTSQPTDLRSSGETQASEILAEESRRIDAQESAVEAVVSDSPRGMFRTPGFHRMKVAWGGDDQKIIDSVSSSVNDRIQARFRDAYQLMHDMFIVVREPMVDLATGEIVRDKYGWPEWKRTASGGYEEDWSRLSRREKEDLLFTITTRVFAWEMAAAEAWGEAMFAKAQWEERFAISYDAPVTGTIDDRTARGRIEAAEERYFGIMLTLYSRKADAIVRTMTLLAQRLKDTIDLG